ncbi:MAG: hypothetical protein ACRDIV_17835 [Ktedonobacteraceae bacterium]
MNKQSGASSKREETVDALLAQALFYSIDKPTTPCQGEIHQRKGQPVRASWEVHFYENFELARQLLGQGASREQIEEAVWEAMCREQDTVGVVTHSLRLVCDLCAAQLAAQHAGNEPAQHVISEAIMAENAFLLVCDRRTRVTALIGALPPDVQESDLLVWLKHSKVMSVLRFEPGAGPLTSKE